MKTAFRRGQVLILVAFLLPVIALFGALALDGLLLYRDNALLNSWTYQAATAGATEVRFENGVPALNASAARNTAYSFLQGRLGSGGCQYDVEIPTSTRVRAWARCTRSTVLIGALTAFFGGGFGSVTITGDTTVEAAVLY